MSNGLVLYEGPSVLDGAPIVVIATGLEKSSSNSKTGALIQIWIMRADVSPMDAVHTGDDVSVCGNCIHRGIIVNGRNVDRSCYVELVHAPRNIWATWKRGKYPTATPEEAAELLRGLLVRLGAYGDPAAVPMWLWHILMANVKAKTGYTHQWRQFPELAKYCMASCDTLADFTEAKAAGWRTFRVRTADEPLQDREIGCPASKEMGKKTSCDKCIGCGGLSAKAKVDFAIIAHGNNGKVAAFERRAT